MTINERIKQLRKEKKLNQKQFADLLGVTQSGVSYMEQIGNNISDSIIKSISTIFSVNEEWIRSGLEPMFVQPDNFSLDDFIKARGGTDIELELVKIYFELDPELRKALVGHFRSRLSELHPAALVPDTPEELEAMCPPVKEPKQDVG